MDKRIALPRHFLKAMARPKDWVALRFRRHKTWLELGWSDYFLTAQAAAGGLASLGLNKGDRVAILSNTRVEWAFLDSAILGLGAVTVPIYQSHRPDEIEYILTNSKTRFLVAEDASQLRKWETIAKKCKAIEQVICLQSTSEPPKGVLAWDELLNRGVEFHKQNPKHFQNSIEGVELSDIATIVYTSGTTGQAKGAVLTHEQILSEVEDVAQALPISPKDSSLTFLPCAHVMGRIELWLHTYVGFTLNYAESIDRLKANLEQTKPTVLIGVPRIFEKIYAGLLTQIEGHPLRKRLFSFLSANRGWAFEQVADRLIFAALRKGLGGRLRFVISGGAPLEPKLGEFFRRSGLLILEAYGLTETTGAITLNRPDDHQIGSVGRAFGDVELKLAEDGEVLVKSRKVFSKYNDDPASTAEVFTDDGFFKTGDVGELSPLGFLRITDRKKDLIKTSGGKYVAPQKLEGLLKFSPLISQVLIHGDRRKYIVALLTLNETYLKRLAEEKAWTYRDYRALTQLPQVEDLVRKHISQVNAQLDSFETIKNFAILPADFTVESGELTPSLKVKRRVLDEKYKDTIDALYK